MKNIDDLKTFDDLREYAMLQLKLNLNEFSHSKKMGEFYERLVLNDINLKSTVKYEKFTSEFKHELSYYDLVPCDRSLIDTHGIEVKFDIQGLKTGNIFLEIGQWNYYDVFSVSGLAITKSTQWICGDGVTGYRFYVSVLRDIINKFETYRQNYYNFNMLEGDELKIAIERNRAWITENLKGFNVFNENILYYPKHNIKQSDGEYKPMRFYLVSREIADNYCLEKCDIDKMTFINKE